MPSSQLWSDSPSVLGAKAGAGRGKGGMRGKKQHAIRENFCNVDKPGLSNNQINLLVPSQHLKL